MRALVYSEFVATRLRDGRINVSSLELDAARFRLDAEACVAANGGITFEDLFTGRPILDARTFASAAQFPTMRAALKAAIELNRTYPDELAPESGEWRSPGLRVAVDLNDEDKHAVPWRDPLRLARALCATAPAGNILISHRAVGGLREALPTGTRIECVGNLRLRDLMPRTAVYRLTDDSLGADQPSLHTLDSIPNNLPIIGNRFVGRSAERREVRLLLQAHRLVSIVGASGLGKTRLALQTAAEISPEYAAGVWLVELAELDDADLIPEAIAGAMGLNPTARADRLRTVIGAIKDDHTLILIENCEHLMERSASIVGRLLAECPNLRILATSIQALGVDSEHVYELPALAMPAAEGLDADRFPDTLALLAVRAFERGAPIKFDAQTLEHAAALCRLLEGNPLAIELAAARATELKIPELYTRVRERFEALGEMDAPTHSRMRSLQAAIDWSIHLLSPRGQLLFHRFSVFRGGAAMEAISAVTADGDLPVKSIRGTVDELVAKHLLTKDHTDVGQRLCMLESLRTHAAGQLQSMGTKDDYLRRHADYYAREVSEVAPLLNGPEQLPALRYLRSEHGNIRGALEYLLETRDLEAGLRLAASLRRFWATSGFFGEGRRVVTRLLETEESRNASDGARAAALFSLGSLETRLSDFEAAEGHIRDALELATRVGDESVTAKAHNALGRIAWRRGLVVDARDHYEAALSLLERLDHPVGIATAQNNLALTDLWFGEYSKARERLEHSLDIAHEVSNQRGIAETLNNLAGVVEIQSDYTASRVLIAQCLAVLQKVEDRRRTPMAINNLAHIALRRGRIQDARELCEEAMRQQREFGDTSGIALSSIERGLIALDSGETDNAQADFDVAWAISHETGESRLAIAARHGLSEIARRRGDLESARLALDEGLATARSMPDHLETSRYLSSLGRLELDAGNAEAAKARLVESLRLRHQIGNRRGVAETLEVMARATDNAELAARLLGAAGAGRAEIGAPLPPAEIADVQDSVGDLRSRLGEVEFDRAFAAGGALSLAEIADEVLAAFQPQ